MDRQQFEKKYDFALDPYQAQAIDHLAEGHSVLVAAPTGSGKTVVAEFALEKARSEGKKFFYTTPLKALSNQKFRDLSRAYTASDVGLLTGDNSINGDAPLVVMTTEVLRNMIYEESELLEDLGAVVLDEVHYMQDPFRGGVWEEIVILLPRHITLVGLSATISNARELGEWMDSLRGDVRVVVSTERPVQLKNLYFVGRALVPLFAKNLQRVLSEQMDIVKKAQAAREARRGRRGKGGPSLTPRRTNVIAELERQDMLPAIYFLFSRAACSDSVARWLEEGDRLNPPEAGAAVAAYLDDKIASLERADLECLDYAGFRRALTAGVAAHHAGELPLFKEAVEELFARGLVKVVFATETLSLGINMPARTVVIESLSKWTGEKHRPLSPGEYKQLTGRAGRRGIDEVGYAVVLYQKYFSPDHVRSLVTRESSPVVSSFQVTYNMAVNVLAVHDLEEAQRLINLSFAQFVADRRVVDLEARLEVLRGDLGRELEASRCGEGGDAASLRALQRERDRVSRRLASIVKERRHQEIHEAMSHLQPGDVFLTGPKDSGMVLAVVRKARERRAEPGVTVVDSSGRYRRIAERTLSRPPRVIGAVDVAKITSPTRKVRRSIGARMEELGKQAEGSRALAAVGPEERELSEAALALKEEIAGHPCFRCQHRERCLEAARRAERLQRQISAAGKERDAGHDVVSRRLVDVIAVLNRFGFLSGEKLTRKGQTLRKIYNECDLLLVEALYGGLLSSLEPRELAAAASWVIYESRDGESARDREARESEEYLEGVMGDLLGRLEAIEAELKGAEGDAGLDLLGSLDTGFGEAAYMWAGDAELEQMLERFPERSVGDMVRTMKQIIDLLRQLADVSPDLVLTRNLGKAMDAIDRGVVGFSSIESIIEHESPVEGPVRET
jgi:ATP-dependent RNA helicase HelY